MMYLLRHRGLAVLALCVLAAALCGASARRPARFDDLYACYIITDAEAANIARSGEEGMTEYDEDLFEQVDYEDFLSLIRGARLSDVAFEPAWQVNLYDDDGVRYRIFFSRSLLLFRIDSNYFSLSRRKGKRMRALLEASL